MEPQKKRGRGRPKVYSEADYGAPRLTVRVAPDVHDHVTTRPEGARAYLERVVRADREATATGEDGSKPVLGDSERAEEA